MKSVSIVLGLLSFVLSARAVESYTNLAGKVISATPVKVDGRSVTFDCGAAGVRALPMGIFPSGEQKRIKAAVGVWEMPGELKGLAAEIGAQRARYVARAKAGKLSQEKLADNLGMLSGSWAHAVETSTLSAEEKSYWKGKCP